MSELGPLTSVSRFAACPINAEIYGLKLRWMADTLSGFEKDINWHPASD
jgi:hypothetical protein